ncbi:RNB-domain-containing protein [Suhomyces tanzawaensis NRRL Y-17324]|uniref:RNB-domain-containing protein n=1 Tax=Suhomyces tanzawaensis NRRL Y-17324 TaxID=984487 RepID=A0A1E4SS87_9ASCO|nr:RNB-domain-containing protein [Suhomyces tanzawaensis NRRL Y-17324]ODV82376.1 RNB-domain-containing protein [Suhomyces tanzawaensis NRRL Y-17324]
MHQARPKGIRWIRYKSTNTSQKANFIPQELKNRHKYFPKASIPHSTTVQDDNSRRNLVKNLLKSTGKDYTRSKGNYFDPANSQLNLSLNNSVLFDKISKATIDRTAKRFEIPSKDWKSDIAKLLEGLEEANKSKVNKIRRAIHDSIINATISSQAVNDSTNIGDLVTLYDDNVNLYLVVEIPTNLSSSSYTFINNEGEVVYAKRSAIKLRFPGVIPKKYHDIVRTFVQLEKKYLDIAPVGVANDKYTKSVQSLPQELQDPEINENVSTKSRLQAYRSSKLGSALENGIITEDATDIAVEGTESISSENDFLVAQASSQFLTNSNVNTYHVPIEARKFYSKALTDVSIKAFNQLSLVNTKLEVLHRKLQYDYNHDLINSPRTISIFEILYHIEHTDLTKLEDYNASVSHIGKSLDLPFDFESQQYHVSTFLALIISLRKQSRLWNIDKYSKSYPPASVTILPIKNVELINNVIYFLKFKKGDSQFANYAMKKSGPKPQYYEDIIQMFKDYIIGNFTSDPVLETLLVGIVRLVDKHLGHVEGIYSYEYSKARAYDLLNCLQESPGQTTPQIVNPGTWYKSLPIAEDISIMSNLSKDYYEFIDKHLDASDVDTAQASVELSKDRVGVLIPESKNLEAFNDTFGGTKDKNTSDFYTSDPLCGIREDFRSIPIYCIDSADAHEIDDGISIHLDARDYIISTHIADPASYLRPHSIISSIAFSKGRTTYLPEGPSMMLPKLIPNLSGLGINGKETRTFVIQYKLNKAIIDSYIEERLKDSSYELPSKILTQIQDQIKSTANIKVAVGKNFPQGYTYEKVDSLLKDESKINNFRRGITDDKNFQNLFKLWNISTILHNIRVLIGEGTQFAITKSNIKVMPMNEARGELPSFKHIKNGYEMALESKQAVQVISSSSQGENSRSQLLVSEFMIFANQSSASFAHRNDIKIIYRSQEMILTEEVKKTIHKLIKDSVLSKQKISEESLSKILSVLTSAKTQIQPKRHESLGVDSYTNVTSPLRRYTDILNHWKFEEYLLKKSDWLQLSDSNLQFIANHLQNMELINNQIQRFSSKFWEGIFLKEYLLLLKQGKIPSDQKIKFRVLIRSNPRNGNVVLVDVLGFSNLHSKLEVTPTLMELFKKGEVQVGQILESDRIKIVKVDFIEDELILEYK